jgi:hypothetical protein
MAKSLCCGKLKAAFLELELELEPQGDTSI